jgi:Flp pilus assembly protein TadG
MRSLRHFAKSTRARAQGLAGDERGSSALETALGMVVMITMVLGIIEMCMMVYTYSVYADATREGIRYATTHGSDSTSCSGPTTGCTDTDGTNVQSAVTSYAANFVTAANAVSVVVSYPDSASTPNSRVAITTTYTYKPVLNFPGLTPSFTVSSAGRIIF